MTGPNAYKDIVQALDLAPHPEGGYFRETFRHAGQCGGRGLQTAILYLLAEGQRSHWHRVTDADEIWHFHGGAPLALLRSGDGRRVERAILGASVLTGEMPQIVVPAGVWQSASPMGAWTLVGCTVAPAFEFSSFEMAPPGWAPGEASA
jgi:uncharacterized protein